MNAAYASDPTVSSAWAELRIHSDELSASRISGILDLVASETVVKGDKTGPRHSGFPQHGWFLSTDGQSLPADARAHLDSILDRLLEVRDRYLSLVKTGDVTVSLCLFWWASEGSCPIIGAVQSRKMCELGLDLTIQFRAIAPENLGRGTLDS